MVDRGLFHRQEIRFLDHSVVMISARVKPAELPIDFRPGSWDCLCTRGKDAYNHIGNRRLRVLVDSHLEKYQVQSKIEKGYTVSSIVETMRAASGMGGFVKQNETTGKWVEVGDKKALEKVGQLLREAMTRKNPVKLQSRKDRRKARALKRKNASSFTKKLASDSSTSTAPTTDMTSCSSSFCSDTNIADSLDDTSTQALSIPLLAPVTSFGTNPLPLDAENSTAFVFSFEGIVF